MKTDIFRLSVKNVSMTMNLKIECKIFKKYRQGHFDKKKSRIHHDNTKKQFILMLT